MSATINPRRCLLFVPGARADRFAKALASGADQICIDLEDAVALADKETAREATYDFIAQSATGSAELGVRINTISSELGIADLKRLIERGVQPQFVMLPKIESAHEIAIADKLLSGTAIPLIAQLESPRAVFEARNIAKVTRRLQALMFGGFDYAVAARVKPGRDGWLWARGQIAAAAAEAEIGAIDVPSLDIKNLQEIAAETEHVISLGFTAKAAIHPAQIAAIQNVFLPTDEENAHAQKVLAAVASAKDAAIAVDGKLVDRPIELAARRIAQLSTLGLRQTI
jgi:citrate lyase beta subunit